MTETSTTKILFGGALLLAGTAIILAASSAGGVLLPGIVGSVAALAMAAGALLVGTSEGGRPV
ncbi:hypothetical protein [Salinibaculum rarum]|uniref:hypothetical protein n=1 Tax=Salinibaculum rarum TaxID=3058903 RepID=UPI00265E6119|nr:hypothetical protein [Salinibaculum sp. KK48]